MTDVLATDPGSPTFAAVHFLCAVNANAATRLVGARQ